jgi:predicted nucleic acid-binding protein
LKSYADTSFLVSLYVPDAHSAAASAAMKQARGEVMITVFGEVELLNAIQLRVFRRELTPAQAKSAAHAFEDDLSNGVFALHPIGVATFESAKRLAARHTHSLGVRTLDLLHVSAALVLEAEALYTFDLNQRKLARAADLAIRPTSAKVSH